MLRQAVPDDVAEVELLDERKARHVSRLRDILQETEIVCIDVLLEVKEIVQRGQYFHQALLDEAPLEGKLQMSRLLSSYTTSCAESSNFAPRL